MLIVRPLLLALVVSACNPAGLTHDQVIDAALRNAPPSAIPITVESVQDGPLGRFLEGAANADATRHVWAVALVGAFEGEGVQGNVPHYRNHLVLLDFKTGEFIAGTGSQ